MFETKHLFPIINIFTGILGYSILREILALIRKKPPGKQTLLDALHVSFLRTMQAGIAVYCFLQLSLSLSSTFDAQTRSVIARVTCWPLYWISVIFYVHLIICSVGKFLIVAKPHWIPFDMTDNAIVNRVKVLLVTTVVIITIYAEAIDQPPKTYYFLANLPLKKSFLFPFRATIMAGGFLMQGCLYIWIRNFYLDKDSDFANHSNELVTNKSILGVAFYQIIALSIFMATRSIYIPFHFMSLSYTIIYQLSLIYCSNVLRKHFYYIFRKLFCFKPSTPIHDLCV